MPNPLTFSNSAPAYFEDKASDWVPESGKLARHSADVIVYPSNDSAWDSIMYKYDFHARLVRYQQPGYYNDPGFLIPDHPSLSQNKKKTPLCALGFHRCATYSRRLHSLPLGRGNCIEQEGPQRGEPRPVGGSNLLSLVAIAPSTSYPAPWIMDADS